jgi:hypothetical protein
MGGIFNLVNLHVYHYAGNNPVKYVDPDGRAAGDEFDSIDEAAMDFAHTYNDDSIVTNREYGSTIYSYDKDGKTKYSYTIPNRGPKEDRFGNGEVRVSTVGDGQTAVAKIHTHGSYNPKDIFTQNYPSIPDQENANIPTYVVGPAGILSVYDPNTMVRNSGRLGEEPHARLLTTPDNNNIPRDINDTYNPTNSNVVNSSRYTRDPYYGWIRQFINRF